MTFLFLFVLFLHWLADFVFQTRWMAENKSKDNRALTTHVAIYSLVFLVGLLIMSSFVKTSFLGILGLVSINGIIHWCVDYVTSRMNAKFFQTQQMTYFWWNIGFDQFIHQACLILLASWLL